MRRMTVRSAPTLLVATWEDSLDAVQRMEVSQLIEESLQGAVEVRHGLHQDPELGRRELEIEALEANELRTAGGVVEEGVALTGVVGDPRCVEPGPVVAVRADMGALPVSEETDLSFRSTKRGESLSQDVGLADACRHDIHSAVVL
jgi:metal-dependent amidase/aminoacylase/carboxypeptidase family protein